jgi:hypothetical protein
MRWKDHREVYRAGRLPFPVGGAGFVQGPQALVLDDRVRVYVSTRESDAEGMYRSHVTYVDMDRGMRDVIGVATRPVIPLGALGTYDEHGIFPFHVVRAGPRILGLATGWTRRRSVSADAAILVSESLDGGETFTRWGPGPVLGPSLHEPFLIGDAYAARVAPDRYRVWYIAGRRWIGDGAGGQAERIYRIVSADTQDFIAWNRHGVELVTPSLGDDECQAMPTVVHHDDVWHMYFCTRHAFGFRDDPSRGYRIGYAWSHDAMHWTRDDARGGFHPSGEAWDDAMQCYPHLVAVDGRVHMLYNGNAFGRWSIGIATLDAP